MIRLLLVLTLFSLSATFCAAQHPITAQETVPRWLGPFGYGSNMGVFAPHYYDKELATLLVGKPDGTVPGVGVNSLRPGLFEYFLEYFGYGIRLEHFKYYKSIGARNQVAIIGYPSEAHREKTEYCPGARSELFAGMYEPIWDDGINGTPVNENNPYALYCWKTANMYKGLIRTWEVWNEPDAVFSFTSAWKDPGMEGNWWENTPTPCEYTLRAPIFHYIRMLRISYEVFKSVDPNAMIAPGGLGWPSFLDLLCRYSDNPDGGAVTAQFPRTGGAYFDCMSFHSYPHIDNSLRTWDNSIGGFRYFRHSDAAVDGVWKLRDKFKTVLTKYGYDGVKFPQKIWINTEYGLPRKEFGDYIGSNEAQCNFVTKTLVTAQMNDMAQMFYYTSADEAPEGQSDSEFAYMGFFKNLNNVVPYEGERNLVSYAHKTTKQQLAGKTYDKAQTAKMQLPENVRGAAFSGDQGKYTYVLWATTKEDKVESSSATYNFPAALSLSKLEQRDWNHSMTGALSVIPANQIQLTGSPIFLTPVGGKKSNSKLPTNAVLYPNPAPRNRVVLSFMMQQEGKVTAELVDISGQVLQNLYNNQTIEPGPQQLPIDLSDRAAGTYFVRLTTPEGSETLPVVNLKN